MRIATLLLTTVSALLLSACTAPITVPLVTDAAHATPGALYSFDQIGGYPTYALRALIWWNKLAQKFPIDNGVSLYRARYWTHNADGKLVLASGLIALPRVARLRGVVSFQHGTATLKDSAPSTPDPQNGVLAAAAFAARGYLLTAPDYLGLGTSTLRHPYLHAQTEADAVTDLLRAAQTIVAQTPLRWPGHVLLVGFSQGGHATLATQRALEANPVNGITVAASASIAGPFDLAGLSFPNALQGQSSSAALYLAYMVTAYAAVYNESLATTLRAPYVALAPSLFDGKHDGNVIEHALPTDPRTMFREDFLQSFASGQDNWLHARLSQNSLDNWTPRAPIRLYYGARDVDVSPREALQTAQRLQALGGDVQARDIGAYDHEQSVLNAVPLIVRWFNDIANTTAQTPARG